MPVLPQIFVDVEHGDYITVATPTEKLNKVGLSVKESLGDYTHVELTKAQVADLIAALQNAKRRLR